MSWEEEYQDSWMYLSSKTLDANAKGHTWIRDDVVYPDGYVGVDHFAAIYETGYHNGPRCESCGYEFCEHCTSLKRIRKCPSPMPGLLERTSELVRFKRGARS